MYRNERQAARAIQGLSEEEFRTEAKGAMVLFRFRALSTDGLRRVDVPTEVVSEGREEHGCFIQRALFRWRLELRWTEWEQRWYD